MVGPGGPITDTSVMSMKWAARTAEAVRAVLVFAIGTACERYTTIPLPRRHGQNSGPRPEKLMQDKA
jgi:hypothetical protein